MHGYRHIEDLPEGGAELSDVLLVNVNNEVPDDDSVVLFLFGNLHFGGLLIPLLFYLDCWLLCLGFHGRGWLFLDVDALDHL